MSPWWLLALWPISGVVIPVWLHTRDADLTLHHVSYCLFWVALAVPFFSFAFSSWHGWTADRLKRSLLSASGPLHRTLRSDPQNAQNNRHHHRRSRARRGGRCREWVGAVMRPQHDTPQKRLLRELRERGAISTDEIVARGRNVQRAIEELRQRCLVSVRREEAKLTAKGIAHAVQV